ncbi:MAG: tetratricopeptide repeat protein [Deltaproteobacteria bacterium]|jgi:hypothetical protein|nr:tetratricopeptide repeat protein [Deltaproteobacteria bacterium]
MAWNSSIRDNRRRWLGPLAVVVFWGLGNAGSSFAAEPSKTAKQEAKARFTTGQRHYNLNEFAEALIEFKEAYRLLPDPAFLYNLGQCERQLGHHEEALRFYRSFLREEPKAPNRLEVLNKIEELEAAIKSKEAEAEKAVPPPPALEPAKPVSPPAEAQPAVAPAPLPPPVPTGASAGATPPPAPAQEAQPLPATPPVNPEIATGPSDPIDLTASQTPQPEAGTTPVYKRWWFWTAAAVVVAGAGIGIYAATSGGGTEIPGSALGTKKVF